MARARALAKTKLLRAELERDIAEIKMAAP